MNHTKEAIKEMIPFFFFFFPFFMRSSSNWPHKDKSSLVEACYSICQDWFNCSSWEAAALSLSPACSLTHRQKKEAPTQCLRPLRPAFTSQMWKMVPVLLISTKWNTVLQKARRSFRSGKEVHVQCLKKSAGAWRMLRSVE